MLCPRTAYRPIAWILTIACFGISSAAIAADTFKVPGDFPTIQDAVDAADAGDEITIEPGVYEETVVVARSGLTIRSSEGEPDETIWTSKDGPALVIEADAGLTVESLTFVRGADASILCSGTLVVRSSIFRDGNEEAHVIHATGKQADVTIESCIFAELPLASEFALVRIEPGAAGRIRDGRIDSVEAEGALIDVRGTFSLERVEVTKCQSNSALMHVEEGALAVLRTCLVHANEAVAPVLMDGTLGVVNSTIDFNDVSDANLAVGDGEELVVVNSIVRGDSNLPPVAGSIPTDFSYSNIQNAQTGLGVIDADPIYISNTDFRLDAGSPGIDAADADIAPDADFDQGPRSLDDPNIPDTGVGTEKWVDMGAFERLSDIRYVRADAPAGGDGLSWNTAFNDLQDGISAVFSQGDPVRELWVAAGSYRPDRGTNNRNASFILPGTLKTFGGFTGDELRRDARRPRQHETILTGEIGGPGLEDNAQKVAATAFSGSEVRLSGFTIERGFADGSSPLAASGGGLFVRTSSGVFDQLIIRACNAGSAGSAIFALNSTATFDRIRVYDNGGSLNGRGVVHGANDASRWSQIQADGNFTVAGSTLDFVNPVDVVVDGSTVVNNRALVAAGGIGAFSDDPVAIDLRNSIVWGNTVASPVPGTPLVQTQIFNVAPAWSTVEFAETDPSTGLNGLEPAFRDELGPDGQPGTIDDDFRLAAGSSMIDAGNGTLTLLPTATDLLGISRRLDDTGTVDTGVGGTPIIDRGAHEFDGTSCPTDVNRDGVTGFDDLLAVLAAFGACPNCAADINADGIVDFSDLLAVLAAFGPCP
ncbi:MAG: hypothetical protein AB8G96_06960 [Phycisphaerales bacterium]